MTTTSQDADGFSTLRCSNIPSQATTYPQRLLLHLRLSASAASRGRNWKAQRIHLIVAKLCKRDIDEE